MNFAFYGRASTSDHREAEITQTQQRAQAQDLVGPAGGRITREFFDIGIPSFTGWRYRAQAARLLAALPDPKRGFDAVVVADGRSAFSSYQYSFVLWTLTEHGLQLWLPEVGGAVQPDNPEHESTMTEVFWGIAPEDLRNPQGSRTAPPAGSAIGFDRNVRRRTT